MRKERGPLVSFAPSAVDLRVKSVLIATDFSPASVKPLHHAMAIARHYRAKLYIAHVIWPVGYLMAGPEALELGCEGARNDAQELQRILIAKGLLEGLDYELIVRQGGVWDELQEIILEDKIDLVVLGTHARRGIEKLLLGSVAEQVFRNADCPVLTVGPHSYQEGRVDLTDETQTYLFATDFGEASLHALPHAISLAHHARAKLILLHVVPVPRAPEASGWYSASDLMLMRENARMAYMRQLEHLLPKSEQAPLETESVVQFGVPSEKILHVALKRQADLIILGLRRPSLVITNSHIPWTTAYEVVCGAGCPVLSVRK